MSRDRRSAEERLIDYVEPLTGWSKDRGDLNKVRRLIREVKRECAERAKRECEERAELNDAVEGETGGATDIHTGVCTTASGHRAIEARECAFAVYRAILARPKRRADSGDR